MKKVVKIALLVAVAFSVIGLWSFTSRKKEKVKYVEITTSYGAMKFKLYNETPLHRDNFIKLVDEGYYDSLLFHRVINQFMIQGGDPDSKNAPAKKMLGNGGPDYEVPMEVMPGLYHKKGVLAAAREGNDVNPEKKSSGSQFYIVQGKIFDSTAIQGMEIKRMKFYRSIEFNNYLDRPENKDLKVQYAKSVKKGDSATTDSLLAQINPVIDQKMSTYKFSDEKYTAEQIEVYGTVGGTPHLDYEYTVFGEMISGFEVLDSIAIVQTDKNDRPVTDVLMSIKIVKK